MKRFSISSIKQRHYADSVFISEITFNPNTIPKIKGYVNLTFKRKANCVILTFESLKDFFFIIFVVFEIINFVLFFMIFFVFFLCWIFLSKPFDMILHKKRLRSEITCRETWKIYGLNSDCLGCNHKFWESFLEWKGLSKLNGWNVISWSVRLFHDFSLLLFVNIKRDGIYIYFKLDHIVCHKNNVSS